MELLMGPLSVLVDDASENMEQWWDNTDRRKQDSAEHLSQCHSLPNKSHHKQNWVWTCASVVRTWQEQSSYKTSQILGNPIQEDQQDSLLHIKGKGLLPPPSLETIQQNFSFKFISRSCLYSDKKIQWLEHPQSLQFLIW